MTMKEYRALIALAADDTDEMTVRVEWEGGECESPIPLTEFFDLNADGIGDDERAEITADLIADGVASVGGGAAALAFIRRV